MLRCAAPYKAKRCRSMVLSCARCKHYCWLSGAAGRYNDQAGTGMLQDTLVKHRALQVVQAFFQWEFLTGIQLLYVARPLVQARAVAQKHSCKQIRKRAWCNITTTSMNSARIHTDVSMSVLLAIMTGAALRRLQPAWRYRIREASCTWHRNILWRKLQSENTATVNSLKQVA